MRTGNWSISWQILLEANQVSSERQLGGAIPEAVLALLGCYSLRWAEEKVERNMVQSEGLK